MTVRNQAVARETNSPYVPRGVGFIAANVSPGFLVALDSERKRQIGDRLKELREGSPYTQEAIADRLGITVRAYQKQEATGGVSYDNIEKLAELHGVEADWILKGDTETPDLLGGSDEAIIQRIDDLAATVERLARSMAEFVAASAPQETPRKKPAAPRRSAAKKK
jgi:transcriptional regulator with XRE-family HTH domain